MTLKEGDIINGRYRLISERGRGTFGEVWQAWDSILDMEVALKIYIALDDRGVEEFKSEYRTAFKLNHPNLLHASYFDVTEKRPYLVMPYCPVSTDEMVGKTTEEEAWKFIKDVSSGLAYLHSKNILHRDIKPDNILVDEQGDYLISDFGISQKMRNTLRRNSVKDLPGSGTSGTVGYMGPELFSNKPLPVMATDIWALGATLFELLEGDLPFFGQGGVMLLHGGEVPNMKGPWSDSLKSTLSACLSRDTWERPKAEELELFASSRIAGSKVEAPWEQRWRELKKAEEERERQEEERRRKIEEQKAEEARIKAEEEERRQKEEDIIRKKEEARRLKEEKRQRKVEKRQLKEETALRQTGELNSRGAGFKSSEDWLEGQEVKKSHHRVWPFVAAAIVLGAFFLWRPWEHDGSSVQGSVPEQSSTIGGVPAIKNGSDATVKEIEEETEPEIITETLNQQSEEERLAEERKKREADRLAKERKEKEELARRKAAEEAARKAEEASTIVIEDPLQTAMRNNNWLAVKQLADSGDTDACAEYAKHYFNIDYDVAHRYALKAGRAKGASIVKRLRDIGYYDDAVDPGW